MHFPNRTRGAKGLSLQQQLEALRVQKKIPVIETKVQEQKQETEIQSYFTDHQAMIYL